MVAAEQRAIDGGTSVETLMERAGAALAEAAYRYAGRGAPYNFTGTVRRATGAPSGNFKITAQSITAGNGATAICSSDLYVSAP